VEQRVPKLQRGPCLPDFLEPRRTAEKALPAVIDARVSDFLAWPMERLDRGDRRSARDRINTGDRTTRGQIERCADVVGIFPNAAAVVRLAGAILLEQSNTWAAWRSRSMTLEAISAVSDTSAGRFSAVPA